MQSRQSTPSPSKGDSPLSHPTYLSLPSSKQAVIKRLLTIFTFYCGRVSKYNYNELHQKYFMQIYTDLALLNEIPLEKNSQAWTHIENIYYAKTRKVVMNFNCFIDVLPQLAVSLNRRMDETEAMTHLLQQFDCLYSSIDRELADKGITCRDLLEENTLNFLVKLKESLSKLYRIYFSEEITTPFKIDREMSFRNYLQAMKEFEVYPKLASSSTLYFIFNLVCEQENPRSQALLAHPKGYTEAGNYFTLSRFVEAFVILSGVCRHKLKAMEKQLDQKEAVKLLFEYMETIRTSKRKHCKFSRERISLIVYEEYMEEAAKTRRELRSPSEDTKPNKFYDIFEKIRM